MLKRKTSVMVLRGLCLLIFGSATASAASPPTVEFLSAEQAWAAIIDDKYDDFFGRMQLREIAAMTGSDVENRPLDQARQFARKYFQSATAAFEPEEKEALRWYVSEIDKRFGEKYPLVTKGSWQFLRVKPKLCSGFSFTRGEAIIIGRPLRGLVEAYKAGDQQQALQGYGPLLVHERMHVLQRLYPKKFADLYQNVFGYKPAKVVMHPWIDRQQIGNPDGQDENWVLPYDSPTGPIDLWLGTILKGERKVPRMGQDFQNIAVQMQSHGDEGVSMAVGDDGLPIQRPLSDFPDVFKRFPVRGGQEHPNELSANMLATLFAQQIGDGADKEIELWTRFQRWCEANLTEP